MLNDAVPEVNGITIHLQARREGDAPSKEWAKSPFNLGADGGCKTMERVVRRLNFVPEIIRAIAVARAKRVEGA